MYLYVKTCQYAYWGMFYYKVICYEDNTNVINAQSWQFSIIISSFIVIINICIEFNHEFRNKADQPSYMKKKRENVLRKLWINTENNSKPWGMYSNDDKYGTIPRYVSQNS